MLNQFFFNKGYDIFKDWKSPTNFEKNKAFDAYNEYSSRKKENIEP